MISFDACVVIERPVNEVFGFVSDGENGSKWNSAVLTVTKISPGAVGVGTQYRMERKLGNRQVENLYEVIEYRPNEKLSIRIISGPTPFVYRYSFEPFEKGMRLCLAAEADREGLVEVLGMKGRLAPDSVLARFVKSGVETNFADLKNLLERKI